MRSTPRLDSHKSVKFNMGKYQFALIRLIGLLTILLSFTILSNGSVAAQPLNQWSPRQRIPGSHDEARTPYLVADQNRTIHAFHSQLVGEDDTERAIFYSQWTIDGGWTMPVDVILPPFGRLAVVKGAALDQNGMIHIIFYGGEERNANIYYSRAPVLSADRAPVWSEPEVIGENAIAETAAMAGDGQGNLFVLYASNREGHGLYAVISTDGGDTWSNATPVSLTNDDQLFPYLIHLSLDQENRLHAVWSVNNSGGEGEAIYYIRLESDHITWSKPTALAVAEDRELDQVTDPGIVAHGNGIFVVYNEWPPDSETIRVMRRSPDGGRTWMESTIPFASQGEYGSPDFAVDSGKDLHVFLGDRRRGMNLWHSIWQGNRWTEPEPIAPPSEFQLYYGGPLNFQPWFPRAVVSQGNVILVAWETDRGAIHNGTWYSYRFVNAPEMPVVPISTQSPTPIPSPAATAESAARSGPRLEMSAPNNQNAFSLNSIGRSTDFDSQRSLVLSFSSVAIFIMLVVILQVYRRNH
jgi:hypothetical protein